VELQGDHREAERCYRPALAIRELIHSSGSIDVALTRNNLGKLLTGIGRGDEALPLLASAVAVLEARLDRNHPHLATARANLRAARAQTGRV
jgi:hypothetical protein